MVRRRRATSRAFCGRLVSRVVGHRGSLLAEDSPDLGETRSAPGVGLEGQQSAEHLAEEDAEGIDVRATVDGRRALRLLGAHVFGPADQALVPRGHRLLDRVLCDGAGDAEIDHPGCGFVAVDGHEDVGGLQVTVNAALLVGVLDRLAHIDEELETCGDSEGVTVAVPRDGDATHELHDEVRMALDRRPRIEDPGDMRMVHECEGSTFGLEPRHHVGRVHAGLDDLDRHFSAPGPILLGQVDNTESPVAKDLDDAVRTDAVAPEVREFVVIGPCPGDHRGAPRPVSRHVLGGDGGLGEQVDPVVALQEVLQVVRQIRVVAEEALPIDVPAILLRLEVLDDQTLEGGVMRPVRSCQLQRSLDFGHASRSSATIPPTSVNLNCRPWNLKVTRVWSRPRRCRIVACRSLTCMRPSTG